MKTLFFDCSSGISGNMVLGALTELVGDEHFLLEELKKLHLQGFSMKIARVQKNGIGATYVDVIPDGEDEYGQVRDSGHHHHHHHHPHRNLSDVERIIEDSDLAPEVKELAKRIFLRVAEAESRVHGKALNEVHFHEVGAVDSIVDIVGTAILIHRLSPEKILSGIVNDGHGFIHCAHGRMAVPVPAVCEIFAGRQAAVRQIDVDTELVTPTGAAIIAELAASFGPMPAMITEQVGWGAGTKELSIPNVLKVVMGEPVGKGENEIPRSLEKYTDTAVVIEANIDDCSGEILGYAAERLMESGASDVWFAPIYVKKFRPAYQISVLCPDEERITEELIHILFSETTTIGIRVRRTPRVVLAREKTRIETPYGSVEAKKVRWQDRNYLYPEYESVKALAQEKKIPLKEFYRWR